MAGGFAPCDERTIEFKKSMDTGASGRTDSHRARESEEKMRNNRGEYNIPGVIDRGGPILSLLPFPFSLPSAVLNPLKFATMESSLLVLTVLELLLDLVKLGRGLRFGAC